MSCEPRFRKWLDAQIGRVTRRSAYRSSFSAHSSAWSPTRAFFSLRHRNQLRSLFANTFSINRTRSWSHPAHVTGRSLRTSVQVQRLAEISWQMPTLPRWRSNGDASGSRSTGTSVASRGLDLVSRSKIDPLRFGSAPHRRIVATTPPAARTLRRSEAAPRSRTVWRRWRRFRNRGRWPGASSR
ncbi:MAG: hypothetical protein QOC81_4697 [Thermoanaerobaculia bacterium]|nr:hypothetical protein [Thermoanaerobaculia bacterium]